MIEKYRQGASDHEICSALNITFETFNGKLKTEPLFARLVDLGRLFAKAWWLEKGRLAAAGGDKANFQFWYANMKNRYGWSDKAEATTAGEKPIDQMNRDELEEQIVKFKPLIDKLLQGRLKLNGSAPTSTVN